MHLESDFNNEELFEQTTDDSVFHDRPFLLSMQNSKNNKTNREFSITTGPVPQFDEINICFGSVIAGKSFIRTIENVDTDEEGYPSAKITVKDCGIFSDDQALPTNDDGTGDDWEDSIMDDERINMEVPSDVFKAVESLKDIATKLFKEKRIDLAHKKYEKALCYLGDYMPYDLDDGDLAHLIQLKFSIFLNTSLTSYLVGNGKEAIRCANEALSLETGTDQLKAKAYYRIGLGYLLQKDEQSALDNFDTALRLLPGDSAIIASRKDAIRRRQERKKKEKHAFSRIFS